MDVKIIASIIPVIFLVHLFFYWVFRSSEISKPPEPQRLNYYLPEYDFVERHNIIIQSSPEKVFEAIHNLDMNESKVIKTLLLLRSIPSLLNSSREPKDQSENSLSVEKLIKKGLFFLLEEVKNKELVIGLTGKYWRPTADMVQLSNTVDFINFNQTGYGKAAWNFYLKEKADVTIALSTETRILCLGKQAKFLFCLYWAVIRPYSGWIRLEILKMIKKQAEEKVAA